MGFSNKYPKGECNLLQEIWWILSAHEVHVAQWPVWFGVVAWSCKYTCSSNSWIYKTWNSKTQCLVLTVEWNFLLWQRVVAMGDDDPRWSASGSGTQWCVDLYYNKKWVKWLVVGIHWVPIHCRKIGACLVACRWNCMSSKYTTKQLIWISTQPNS